MELKLTKYAAEQILKKTLRENGMTEKDELLCRMQIVAYAFDVVSERMSICEACKEIQDWFLATF